MNHLESEPTQPAQVYEPNRQLSLGWRVWPEMFAELYRARELLWRLAWRDVRGRTKQSVFGLAVNVLTPLALMGMFALLNYSRVIRVGGVEVPYPLFLYAGLLPWQMLAGGLSRATPSLVEAANLVGKIQFPRETLILSGVAQALLDYVLGLPVLVILLFAFGQSLEWTVVFVPILLLLEVLLVSGLGLLLALAHAAVRDVGNALPLALVVGMFVTPIIYADATETRGQGSGVRGQEEVSELNRERYSGENSQLSTLNSQLSTPDLRPPTPDPSTSISRTTVVLRLLNPMHPMIVSYRDLMFRGRLTMPGSLAWSGFVCVAVWLFGWRVFHLVEPKIAERV